MMLSRPHSAKMTIKDRKHRTRTITARLIEGLLPDEPWHYVASVTPSKSGRRYRSDDGEPLERFMSRIISDLRGHTPPGSALVPH